MANGKTQLLKKNAARYDASDKTRHNGKGEAHHHNGQPSNGTPTKTRKRKPGTVNWLSHWEFDENKRRVIIDFPSQNCTEAQFKKVVRNYVKSWLEMINIYKPKGKQNKFLDAKLKFKFNRSKSTVKVRAFLDPNPEPKDHHTHSGRGTGAKGGGHLIPPEPPPPPPGGDSVGS